MRIPGIVQQPVGEFASGNIRQPEFYRESRAQGRLAKAGGVLAAELYNGAVVSGIDEATGEAAKELTELRAKLVNENMLDASFVGDDAVAELQINVADGEGGRQEVSAPRVFTHEVAGDLWDVRSQEIVDHYEGQISGSKAKQKFREEVMTRYVAPGASAVIGANIQRGKAYGHARAERAVEEVLAAGGPTEARESGAREIIARQALLGADPVWVENQLQRLGPMVDQIDIQHKVMAATTADQIDQVEESMWANGSRMTPEQMRTQSAIMDRRRQDFIAAKKEAQTGNADEMFVAFAGGQLTIPEIAQAVGSDSITREAGFTFLNGLQNGSTTKASNPFTLSQYRGEISKLQYTGNRSRVTDKAKLLKLMITRGSMGLNANGTPTGQAATISGEDVFKLNKDIDHALGAALESDEYNNARDQVMAWTRTKLDLGGVLSTAFDGSQGSVEAGLSFITALDNYMDQFGVDADPAAFFQTNRDAYDPRKFADGVDKEFVKAIPQAEQFMIGDDRVFGDAQQDDFLLWLAGGAVGAGEQTRMIALYNQYYQGQGIAPEGGRLMLEPDDPLYRQFEAMIPDAE